VCGSLVVEVFEIRESGLGCGMMFPFHMTEFDSEVLFSFGDGSRFWCPSERWGLFHHLNVDSHFSSCNLEFIHDRVVPVLLARRDEGLNIWSGMVFLVFSICWQGDLCLFSFLLFDERL
jgi:hypothetical protein